MATDRKLAFRAELDASRRKLEQGDRVGAFAHLERAHIIGQLSFLDHVLVHLRMLGLAASGRDSREIRGQIVRLFATIPGHLFGWVPIGNTGGSNVSPIKPMPIPADLTAHFQGFSLRRQVARQWLIVIALSLAAGMLLFTQRAYARAGERLTISSGGTEGCEKLMGYEGSEDVVVDRERGLAYAIGGNRRSFRGGGPGRAVVRVVPLTGPVPSSPADIAPPSPSVFRSFGADLHISSDGTRRLFVANRPDDGHTIEVFRLEARRLVHERTLKHPLLRNPNEVVALGPDRALVTLDKDAAAGTLAEVLEGAMDRPSGRVLLLAPTGSRIVAAGLHMANGIVLSRDGRTAFVAEMVGRRLAVFDRSPERETWTLRTRVPLPAGPDNLTLDDDGRVLAAAHPKLLTLAFGYQKSEQRLSPSMILAYDPSSGRVRTLLSSDGREIAGGSVAAPTGQAGTLLIGSAFGPHILRCRGAA